MIKSEYRTPLDVPGDLFLNPDNKKAPCFSQRAEIPRYHLSSPQPHNCGLMGTNIPQRDNGRCLAAPGCISTASMHLLPPAAGSLGQASYLLLPFSAINCIIPNLFLCVNLLWKFRPLKAFPPRFLKSGLLPVPRQ